MHAAGLVTREQQRPDVRLLLPALVAWAVGALAPALPTPAVLVAALGCTLVLLLAPSLHRRGPRAARLARPLAAAVGMTALVLVAVAGHRGVERAGSVPRLGQERAVVTAEARVTSDPRIVGNGSERERRVLVRLTLTAVTGRGATSRVQTPVLAFADRSWADVHWHDTVRLRGRLEPAEPGDDVAALLRVREPPQVLRGPGPVDRAAEHVRFRFRAAVTGLPEDARGLVPALVIGDTSATPDDLTAAMKATSLTHLSAVSGVNNNPQVGRTTAV